MNFAKGSLIALAAFCAGFVAAMLAEPYISGRARDYRFEVEALEKENDFLRSQLGLDKQDQKIENIPEASGPPPHAAPSHEAPSP